MKYKIKDWILIIGMFMLVGILSVHVYNMDYAKYKRVNDGLQSTLERCESDGVAECHIEYIYDRDGSLLYGEVVGQERR